MSKRARVVAVVQARLGSVRLPQKVLRPVLGRPVVLHLVERLGRALEVDEVVVAVPRGTADDPLVSVLEAAGHCVVRGDELDVLDRFHDAAHASRADVVVRITGDCPLVDPGVVDEIVRVFHEGDADYVGVCDPPTFPDGLDTEVFSIGALDTAWRDATEPYDREHVTPFMRRGAGGIRTRNVRNDADASALRWTLDDPADLEVVTAVFDHFGHNEFTWSDVLALRDTRPEIFAANAASRRDEGASLGSGQKLWRRAKQVIPGGGMLLSKRPEMLLPEHWPTYFRRAKGCTVWDLDGRAYLDVSLMGVGTNTLGYGHPVVDEAVARVVADGNLSTLNAPEEVQLAEALVALHPWSDMARFTRSGGEACAIAIRIARAASGRAGVAFCGYHGWHDWYLAANVGDPAALGEHHLPGLDPAGVPPTLAGSARSFSYNDAAALGALLAAGDVGVVIMEVERDTPPAPGFLAEVRALATRYDAVLVFDECTSGFRKVLGGLHLHYGVDPDIAVFGKTLGNGYAINAVIGRREVMDHAQDSFISSTFWTERIGSAAALASLRVMADEDAPGRIDAIGVAVQARWRALAVEAGLTFGVRGIPAISGFVFPGDTHLAYKTLITQEMLKRGYLATTSLYACIEHSDAVLAQYFGDLAEILDLVRSCEEGQPVADLLDGPVCEASFARLT